MTPLVSIIVPHYQTAELVKLCLRSVRKFTTGIPYEVIVVDNASKDGASIDYLRRVEWIQLIERKSVSPIGSVAHCEAVQIAFDVARAPFVLTIHTDTIPIRNDWLQYHLAPMQAVENMAAIGTDKLVLRSKVQEVFRVIENAAMWWKRFRPVRLLNKKPYIRSHCALYRRSILDHHHLRYDQFQTMTAGQGLHHELERLGYTCRLLDPRDVIHRVVHLNHATEILLPELQAQCKTIHLWRGQHRIGRFFRQPETLAILADSSLDLGNADMKRVA